MIGRVRGGRVGRVRVRPCHRRESVRAPRARRSALWLCGAGRGNDPIGPAHTSIPVHTLLVHTSYLIISFVHPRKRIVVHVRVVHLFIVSRSINRIQPYAARGREGGARPQSESHSQAVCVNDPVQTAVSMLDQNARQSSASPFGHTPFPPPPLRAKRAPLRLSSSHVVWLR